MKAIPNAVRDETLPDVGRIEEQKFSDVRLTIEGLEPTGKPGEFVLFSVPIVAHDVDVATIAVCLARAKYESRDIDEGIEKLLNALEAQEMGRVLAERVRQVIVRDAPRREE